MRLPNWDVALATAFDAAQKKSFLYGQFDCALFAADCVFAITGIDYAAELRGYASKIDAYRIVAKYGSLEAMITALLGREPSHPAFAWRGDVILGNPPLAPDEAGECIGICTGTHIAYPNEPSQLGLAILHRSTALKAWSIE